MLPYCLKCTKKIESKSTRDMKTKNKKNIAFIKLCGFK